MAECIAGFFSEAFFVIVLEWEPLVSDGLFSTASLCHSWPLCFTGLPHRTWVLLSVEPEYFLTSNSVNEVFISTKPDPDQDRCDELYCFCWGWMKPVSKWVKKTIKLVLVWCEEKEESHFYSHCVKALAVLFFFFNKENRCIYLVSWHFVSVLPNSTHILVELSYLKKTALLITRVEGVVRHRITANTHIWEAGSKENVVTDFWFCFQYNE